MSERPIVATLKKVLSTRGSLEGALGALAELTSEGLFVVDRERTILHFSKRAEEITGIAAVDVVGRPCVTGFQCSRCFNACPIFDYHHVQTQGVTILRKDGSTVRVRKSGGVLLDEGGEVVGAVEMFSEVGESRTVIPPEDLKWSGVDYAFGAL
ncbi:PAS domain-containing protein, partial [Candidatus Uhrbacteria bacterium]|nr:PAS domain-containing protein [Candidatus Uhrbacteria bacterium]